MFLPFAQIFPGIGPYEMLFVGLIALLLFGKRLPDVARSLGKGVTEFKKGLRGLESELHETMDKRYEEIPYSSETQTPEVPKFEPPSEPSSSSAPSECDSNPETAPNTGDPPQAPQPPSAQDDSDPKPPDSQSRNNG